MAQVELGASQGDLAGQRGLGRVGSAPGPSAARRVGRPPGRILPRTQSSPISQTEIGEYQIRPAASSIAMRRPGGSRSEPATCHSHTWVSRRYDGSAPSESLDRQRSASQSASSSGARMSPSSFTVPAMTPKPLGGGSGEGGGRIWAMGTPRFVTSNGRPVRRTRSSRSRHVALNLETAIVSTPEHDIHGHGPWSDKRPRGRAAGREEGRVGAVTVSVPS